MNARRWIALALAGMASVPGILVVTRSADRAEATVCVGGGRRISVSGCTDIGDTIARYVPPPAAYAPLPEDSTPPPPP
ncbi:hypothetical protein [Mycobacterium nebraskense]|uniref:RNA-binding protein n=1 Tax=Mycobacterium nebraskense TaxID=244292 RepID=A0A0F5NDM1_9MYCO|nr:hypothetical protein [Mycobacterium nebraskense]KKC05181.1 hypothetical protein WU83_09820 [Mycobacterium nebraskense]KLO40843.1 hypothetical protein ABW17_15910 [Mycobacterium nebraskense]MBI2694002.1 hypothetical protein [Mycobacterium nebraskense]MCV7118616.1 hypothetical protein [Mycobacterium nebraskense]ORW25009.1 hypothetical protein AWC17_02525 [Mycobacterium nebraskense]